MACLFRAENIINVENVVAVLVIIAIVLGALARLREDPTRVSRCLILEVGVADAVSRGQVARQSLQRLPKDALVWCFRILSRRLVGN